MRRLCTGISLLLLLLLGPGCERPRESTRPSPTHSLDTTALTDLERFVVRRLNSIGENADIAEKGTDSASVLVTFEGRDAQVYVHPRFLRPTPGPDAKRESFDGITATLVAVAPEGRTWRLSCKLRDFGNRFIDVTSVAEPENTLPAIHRALGCE